MRQSKQMQPFIFRIDPAITRGYFVSVKGGLKPGPNGHCPMFKIPGWSRLLRVLQKSHAITSTSYLRPVAWGGGWLGHVPWVLARSRSAMARVLDTELGHKLNLNWSNAWICHTCPHLGPMHTMYFCSRFYVVDFTADLPHSMGLIASCLPTWFPYGNCFSNRRLTNLIPCCRSRHLHWKK